MKTLKEISEEMGQEWVEHEQEKAKHRYDLACRFAKPAITRQDYIEIQVRLSFFKANINTQEKKRGIYGLED